MRTRNDIEKHKHSQPFYHLKGIKCNLFILLAYIIFSVPNIATAKKVKPARKQNLKRQQINSLKTIPQTDIPTKTQDTLPLTETGNDLLLKIKEAEEKKEEENKKELLQILNDNMMKVKDSCLGIEKDLKTIQVLAGVSTGASGLGTLTSGGALVSGIVKSGKDKKIEENKKEIQKKQLQIKVINGENRLNEIDALFETSKNRRKKDIEEFALKRQEVMKEVPLLYRKYNDTLKEYKSCKEDINKQLEDNNNNEEYKKLFNRKEQLQEIAYQRYKEKHLDNEDPYIKETQIYIEELSKEEKKEWQDIQSKKSVFEKEIFNKNMTCETLKDKADEISNKMYNLDKIYIGAGNGIIQSFGGRNFLRHSNNTFAQGVSMDGRSDVTNNLSSVLYVGTLQYYMKTQKQLNLPALVGVEANDTDKILTEEELNSIAYPEETFTDVDSYINRYKTTQYDDNDKEYMIEQATTEVAPIGELKKLQSLHLEKTQIENNKQDLLYNYDNAEIYTTQEDKDRLTREIGKLHRDNEKLNNTSKTLGNVRTGLMAGSIATSATSTITSGINIKKLDDLIDKIKSCNASINSLKTNLNNAMAEGADTDLTLYKNIANSCNDLDSNNIKDIKGVMTASTIVGGIGTATSVAGTITSALANTEKVRKDDSEEGVKKEKGLNLASNIMAGVTTGTSAGGIVLGAVTLKKLQDNVDRAERCEKVLK
ncbi:MAG: hypothetical protein ACI4N3_00190 [Alphaproteobacteria bacterium]